MLKVSYYICNICFDFVFGFAVPSEETDWKVIVIDKEDRWAPELNDVEDVERLLPGMISNIREWFRT